MIYFSSIARHASVVLLSVGGRFLSSLSSKDKATYYEDEDGRHLWYSTSSSHTFPTASQLLIGIESEEGNKLLDEALRSLEEAISQFPNEIRERAEGMREELRTGRLLIV